MQKTPCLHPRTKTTANMGKFSCMKFLRVPPRWLYVNITDEDGDAGWGEASLEGHTQAVEGCLDEWFERYTGFEAEYVYYCPKNILPSWESTASHLSHMLKELEEKECGRTRKSARSFEHEGTLLCPCAVASMVVGPADMAFA
jgi:L-alanine-DL-glutamate epimerase-like enolase superfamily enzyme